MSDRNDILPIGWNKDYKIVNNIMTFAMVFAIVLVALGGIGCIGGGDSGSSDASPNDGGSSDPATTTTSTESQTVAKAESLTKADLNRRYSLNDAQIKDEFREAIMAQGNNFTLEEISRNGAGGPTGIYYAVNNIPEVYRFSNDRTTYYTDIKIKSGLKQDTIEFYVVNIRDEPIKTSFGFRARTSDGIGFPLKYQEQTIPAMSKIKLTGINEESIRDGEISRIAEILY